MNKIKLNKITRKKFNHLIQGRRFENQKIIASCDELLQKNGPIVSKFKKNESVIIFLSGGIDSIVLWGLLLSKYQLHVYPLTLKKNFFNHELVAVRYFSRFFKKKYPRLFHQPLVVDVKTINKLINFKIPASSLPPQMLLANYVTDFKQVVSPFSGYPFLAAYYGFFYLNQLLIDKKIKINKLIFGITASDSLLVPAQGLTNLRLTSTQLSLLQGSNIECFSLYYEPELGFYLDKKDIIKLGVQLKLPLEKTKSCLFSFYHCGSCSSCQHRKHAFDQARVSDLTWYRSDVANSVQKFWSRRYNLAIYCRLEYHLQKLLKFFYEKTP